MNSWLTWLKALVSAGIGGGASAISSSTLVNLTGGEPLNWHQLGAIAAGGALTTAVAYLKQSPLPSDSNLPPSPSIPKPPVSVIIAFACLFLGGCTLIPTSHGIAQFWGDYEKPNFEDNGTVVKFSADRMSHSPIVRAHYHGAGVLGGEAVSYGLGIHGGQEIVGQGANAVSSVTGSMTQKPAPTPTPAPKSKPSASLLRSPKVAMLEPWAMLGVFVNPELEDWAEDDWEMSRDYPMPSFRFAPPTVRDTSTGVDYHGDADPDNIA